MSDGPVGRFPPPTPLLCVRCHQPIVPGQAYVVADSHHGIVYHVACPTERQIEHRQRMGRA
jgi:hypothetical protein